MTRAIAAAALALALLAPAARAGDDACRLQLGRGWPAATQNYGTAVERLFAGDAEPALRFTLLPRTGAEHGLLLIPAADGGDWTLRYAEAAERVNVWSDGRLELRTAQPPDVQEATIPAAIASRLVEEWQHALAAAAPAGSTAPYSEDDTWLFLVGSPAGAQPALRVSGLEPACELGGLLRRQVALLTEASGEGEAKREKRWRQLGELLDRMRVAVDGPAATADQPEPAQKRRWSLFN